MTEDVILNVTADFIRSSQANLKLALQVERALPSVREHFVRATLEAVEKCFPRPEWIIDRSQIQTLMARNATLILRNKNWHIEGRNSETRITLGSDGRNWTSVWVGAYFSTPDFERVQQDGVIVPRIKSRGFSTETREDVPYFWRYLEGDLRDWSSERFMTEMSCEDGQIQIVSHVSAAIAELDGFIGSL